MHNIQVPLGIILRNENKITEMVDIMDVMHKYVPMKADTANIRPPGDADLEPIPVELSVFHKILFGGDQVTAARARGAQLARCTQSSARDQLRGLLPVCEDWHAKQTFAIVSGCQKT